MPSPDAVDLTAQSSPSPEHASLLPQEQVLALPSTDPAAAMSLSLPMIAGAHITVSGTGDVPTLPALPVVVAPERQTTEAPTATTQTYRVAAPLMATLTIASYCFLGYVLTIHVVDPVGGTATVSTVLAATNAAVFHKPLRGFGRRLGRATAAFIQTKPEEEQDE